MGDYKAFLTIPRKEAGYRPVHDRIQDFGEVEQTLNEGDRRQQASRCMDCGVPFCNWACPLGNRPPEWNDAVAQCHQRFPGVHRTRLPGSLREGVCVESDDARAYDQPGE